MHQNIKIKYFKEINIFLQTSNKISNFWFGGPNKSLRTALQS